jgi:gamma-glutamylcyclotransferase (GGCT)/AIG2-like uncharacterized protein YtfP
MSTKLFAYGTLRQGFAPAEIAGAAGRLRPVGRAVARGRLYDLGAYPGARFAVLTATTEAAAGFENIEGEVYEVPDARTWQELDAYEGFKASDPVASLFVRREIEVTMIDSGEDAVCWAYEYNRLAEIPIERRAGHSLGFPLLEP